MIILLTFSIDEDEKLLIELTPLHLAADRIDPKLFSELDDSIEVRLESMLSRCAVPKGSVLNLSAPGVPGPTKDISVSDSVKSVNMLGGNLCCLEHGDLHRMDAKQQKNYE